MDRASECLGAWSSVPVPSTVYRCQCRCAVASMHEVDAWTTVGRHGGSAWWVDFECSQATDGDGQALVKSTFIFTNTK